MSIPEFSSYSPKDARKTLEEIQKPMTTGPYEGNPWGQDVAPAPVAPVSPEAPISVEPQAEPAPVSLQPDVQPGQATQDLLRQRIIQYQQEQHPTDSTSH